LYWVPGFQRGTDIIDGGERSSPGVSILHPLYAVAPLSTSMLRE
jgi:hypothetical protein